MNDSDPLPVTPNGAHSPENAVEGYRGIWFELGQKSQYGDKYSGGLGTYTSSHVPMAVYSPEADKTFFTWGGTPAADQRHLWIMVSYFDHVTHQVPRPVLVHDVVGVDDPHDDASIQLDKNGYIWILKSGRGRGRPGIIYRSKTPYSIDGFEKISEWEFTYPQIWRMPDETFFLLYTRYTKGRELYWKTSLDGETWSAEGKLAGLGGHYQVSNMRDGKICTFFNYHPDGDVDKRTNVYFAQTTDQGKTWTTVEGNVLDLPLTEVENDARIVDQQSVGKMMYACDLNFDERGNPILLYIVSRDARPGPLAGPREWTVTHWNGTAWESTTVTTSSHNYDMGSLYVDGKSWRIVGPTETGPQPLGTGGEIASWISNDEGKTWTQEKQRTHHSEFNHAYVRRPLHTKDPFYAFWADGDPDKISESRLYFSDSTGTNVWRLPFTMTADFATPERLTP